MTVDRNVRLDVSLTDVGDRTLGRWAARERPREEPDEKARERFDRAFSGEEEDKPAREEEEHEPPRPFDLFGGGAARARSREPAAGAAAAPAWAGQLEKMLSRLMVGEGTAGGKQVRMELSDDVLPGVTVAIQEVDGRLQVEFICSVPASRLRLEASVPQEAQPLAQRLGRDVLLRVLDDNPSDPRALEVLGTCQAPPGA